MISDVRKLRSLREVALRGTVTAAAEAIGYTPSAVSQQLAALEVEVGVPVVERRGRNVALTDAGRLLVEHGGEVLAALERAEAAVAELHGAPVGRIRVGALSSAVASFVPVALRSVVDAHPDLEPEVVVHPLDDTLRELRLGTVDVAVDQSYDLVPHSLFDDLERTLLLREDLLLVSPAADPVERIADAGDRPWVASPENSSCGRAVRSLTAAAGISPVFAHETDDHLAAVSLISAGLAVSVVPSLALWHRHEGLHVAVVPDAHRSLWALTRPAARARPAITAVVEHLAAAAPAFAWQPAAA